MTDRPTKQQIEEWRRLCTKETKHLFTTADALDNWERAIEAKQETTLPTFFSWLIHDVRVLKQTAVAALDAIEQLQADAEQMARVMKTAPPQSQGLMTIRAQMLNIDLPALLAKYAPKEADRG